MSTVENRVSLGSEPSPLARLDWVSGTFSKLPRSVERLRGSTISALKTGYGAVSTALTCRFGSLQNSLPRSTASGSDQTKTGKNLQDSDPMVRG